MFDVEVDDGGLARRAPPSVGGGLETPGGEDYRPPTLGAFVIEVLFWQAFLAFVAFWAFWPKIWKKSFQNLPKWSLGALKSESGASKIEPGALQDAIFKDL